MTDATEEQNLFYLDLSKLYLKLNSHTWLVATVLDSAALDQLYFWHPYNLLSSKQPERWY